MSKDLVVKANVLIEAGYQLTVNEQRLILSAIACIPKGQPIDPNTGYCVSKGDFVSLGVCPKTANREIKEACERLFNRYVTIKTEKGEFKTRWVQDIMKYDEAWAKANESLVYDTIGDDRIEGDYILASLTFSKSVIPFLSDLKSNFTKYLLSDVTGFSSAYSFRLYEFMMQFKSTGYLKIKLTEFRERLDLVHKYSATKDLRVRVIDTAIDEINEKSPFNVTYKLTKTGRKFTHLELKFKSKKVKLDDSKRDADTIDMFTGATDRELKPLNAKTADMFGNLLSYDSVFGGKYARQGEAMPSFVARIKSELQTVEGVVRYANELKKAGYKPNYRKT